MTSTEIPAPVVAGPAEVCLACDNLAESLPFFTDGLGFRIEAIFPADEPSVATLSGHGLRLRLAPGPGGAGELRLPCRDLPPADRRVLTAPNGTRVEWVAAETPVEIPPLAPEFVLARAGEGPPAAVGRAGMVYRDLIPGRQGGRFIASHIAIPDGGPVADWVHFHKVRFQMIFCRRGWVRLVYEDQGPPFVLGAGDCVLQPPRIRHRVLESSPGLEVVELGCPAVHETLADHDMELPTGRLQPDRAFDGQLFVRHVAAETAWTTEPETGFRRRDTGIGAATAGLADAVVLAPGDAREMAAAPRNAELLFGFVLEGAALLRWAGQDHPLGPADAFVIPPGEPWGLAEASDDLALLRVTVG